MRLRFVPVLFGLALLFGAPAQAASLQWSFSADLTFTADDDDPDTDKVIQYLGSSGIKTIAGPAGGMLDLVGDASPVQPACTQCVKLRIIGDTVRFDVDEAYVPSYGYSVFQFKFDRNLGGSLAGLSGANFLSGTFKTLASGWFEYESYAGPITSLTYSVTTAPEPASWALFIAGFGGIGAALRRGRRGPIAARI